MNNLQKKQLEILLELDRVCKKFNINYYICCGTCLGAVRNNKFIPWDSDVDVFMYYSDIEMLEKHIAEFKNNYFLQSYNSDKYYNSISYRLRDTNTCIYGKDDLVFNCNHGIFIDIYPLYFAPNSKIKLKINVIYSYIYRLLVYNGVPFNHNKIIKIISKLLLIILRPFRNDLIKYFKHQLIKYEDGNYVLTYYGQDTKGLDAILYNKEWFMEPTKIMFENTIVYAPTNPDAYLSKKYGNYMILPPKEKQNEKTDYIYYDINRSYKDIDINNILKDKED